VYFGACQDADEESGLFYNGYRTYVPTIGRYTQGDPIGLDGGWNRFGYVGSNPLSYVDPKGLQGCRPVPGGIACTTGATPPFNPDFGPPGPTSIPWPKILPPSWVDGIKGACARATDWVKDRMFSTPPLPTDIVGDQSDPRAGMGKGGKKHTSGPLTPANGGTGDFGKDLDALTGGTRPWQPGDSAPPGSLVGPNGIFGRPSNSSGGSSIDIPANGTKPHETLHY